MSVIVRVWGAARTVRVHRPGKETTVVLARSELAQRLDLLSTVVLPRYPSAADVPAADDLVRAGADECGRVARRFGVPPAFLVRRAGAEPVESQLEFLVALRRWDDRRLAAALGRAVDVVGGRGTRTQSSREPSREPEPTCLRAVPRWQPVEDELNPARGRDAGLWRRCQEQVRELERAVGGLDGPLDPEEFIRRLAAHRGRPIELRQFDHGEVPGGVCGLWIDRADGDVIGYPTDARHALHIVLHEVGHMLRGHRGRAPVADSQLAGFMPDLDPAMVRAVLGRSVYSDVEEREAELIASLVMHRSGSRVRTTPEPAGDDPVARRVRRAFGG